MAKREFSGSGKSRIFILSSTYLTAFKKLSRYSSFDMLKTAVINENEQMTESDASFLKISKKERSRVRALTNYISTCG